MAGVSDRTSCFVVPSLPVSIGRGWTACIRWLWPNGARMSGGADARHTGWGMGAKKRGISRSSRSWLYPAFPFHPDVCARVTIRGGNNFFPAPNHGGVAAFENQIVAEQISWHATNHGTPEFAAIVLFAGHNDGRLARARQRRIFRRLGS